MTGSPTVTAADPTTSAGDVLATASARSLLVTVFGELVWPTDGPVWTSTLVRILQALRPRGNDAVLVAHLRMLSTYREFPRTDPRLPEALVPDWIGRRVARVIEVHRRRWLPALRRRFAELDTQAAA